ncbi:MAG: hypothetical protein CMI16_05580 [Opitutaceae bacterium]|nr:hypothetical protein [Opitutaceae bacterium]|tara:strand:+ start:4421 stop:4600 length:180 start_codon:yes stop_codon:yes gene_type:complete
MSLTIYCNTEFGDMARDLLIEGTREHRLIQAATRSADVLQAGAEIHILPRLIFCLGNPR